MALGLKWVFCGALIYLAYSVNGHSNGAPATSMMIPNHNFHGSAVASQPLSTSPYTLTVSHTEYQPGDQITVTISGHTFLGFMLMARQPGGTTPAGTFGAAPAGTKYCSSEGTQMTHDSAAPKQRLILTWIAPADAGTVEFVATVLQSYDTFWIGITSDLINLAGGGGEQNTPGEATTPHINLPGGGGEQNIPGEATTPHIILPGGGGEHITQDGVNVGGGGNDCPDGVTVDCAADPCMGAECTHHLAAVCVPSYCGGCNALFFVDGTLVDCTGGGGGGGYPGVDSNHGGEGPIEGEGGDGDQTHPGGENGDPGDSDPQAGHGGVCKIVGSLELLVMVASGVCLAAMM